jgi:putative serine/threonine protein kinase
MGVTHLAWTGSTLVGGVRILGKGKNSVVIKGIWKGREVAVKMLRTDSVKRDLLWEASMLSLANSVGVGPELYCSAEDLIVMELVNGTFIDRWLDSADVPQSLVMLQRLLHQAWKLDRLGLRHKELSNPRRHILVDGVEPKVVDFEGTSLGSSGHNVAAVAQYVLLRRKPELLPSKLRPALLKALRLYRRRPTESNFKIVLRSVSMEEAARIEKPD